MIVNNLEGGIGNQLFQLAAGYSHARRIGVDFAINFNFSVFVGQGHVAQKYKKNILSKIPETNRSRDEFMEWKQPNFSFNPIPTYDNLILLGYFQSEKYFSDFSDEIRDLFVFPKSLKKKIDKKMRFSSKKKIGVHIRRGDYKSPGVKEVLPPLNINYFFNAMKLFKDNEVDFLIFTDDFSSVKNEIDLSGFHNLDNKDEIEDLYALSQCDGVIMSNSSFSWWGAWLGKEKYKVVTPLKWFGPKGPGKGVYEDVYNDKWIRL